MPVKITYRKGYPSKKTIKDLLSEFNIHGIRSMDGYEFNHSISWGSGTSNSDMLNFVDSIAALGVKVSEFHEHKSPINGSITFEKKKITKSELENLEGWKLSGACANGGTLIFSKDKRYSIEFNGNNFIYIRNKDSRLTEITIKMAYVAYDKNSKYKITVLAAELYKGHPKDIDELKEIISLLKI